MIGIIRICLSVWVDMFYVCLVCGKSSVSGLCMVMWGVVGGGLIIVCRCGSVCKQIIPVAAGRLTAYSVSNAFRSFHRF